MLVAERLGGQSFAQQLLKVLLLITPYWRRGPLIAAHLCTKKRWFAVATRIGERGLILNPSSNSLRLIVADSYLAQRKFKRTLHHARILIDLDHQQFDGYHLASESLQELGRANEAIMLLEQGLDHCAAYDSVKTQGRSRHVQRYIQAYVNRNWCPLYSLWRAAVLAPVEPDCINEAFNQLPVRLQTFQYWSQGTPPEDVQKVTAHWNQLLQLLELEPVQVFSQDSARTWIMDYQPDFLISFDSAPHYAAESDVFRLAYALSGDVFWIDSDLMPSEHAVHVLNMALRERASMLFLKRKVPYIQSSAFIARAGCPFFAMMAEQLKGFDYKSSEWAEISRLHLIHDCSFGPTTYVRTLERLCAEKGPAIPCHELLPFLQKIIFPDFSISLFSGENLVFGTGKSLEYKQSQDNWKVWARE